MPLHLQWLTTVFETLNFSWLPCSFLFDWPLLFICLCKTPLARFLSSTQLLKTHESFLLALSLHARPQPAHQTISKL